MEKTDKIDIIIKEHVLTAMGAGAIPVPVADIAAVSAVHLNLIKTLTTEMSGHYSEIKGRALLSALVTGTAARAGASFIKLLPGIGTIIGMASQIILSGAVTYAIGRVLVSAYSRGETLDTISGDSVKEEFMTLLKKGKKYASDLKNSGEFKSQENSRDTDLSGDSENSEKTSDHSEKDTNTH